MTTADSHSSSSVDMDAFVQAAIERVQSWPDRIASLEAEVELLQAKNTYLLSRLTYHCDRGDALQAQVEAKKQTEQSLLGGMERYALEIRDLERKLASQTAVVEAARQDVASYGKFFYMASLQALARLDAADVPAASTGEKPHINPDCGLVLAHQC